MAAQQCISAIYKIVHVASGVVYVGSSKDVHTRFRQHRARLNRGIHFNPRLQRAWAKYGPEAFSFQIIEVVNDWRDLTDREQVYLDQRKSDPARLFNTALVAEASMRGVRFSDAHRAKISAALKGREFSAESRVRMSAAQRGKTINPEACARQSAAILLRISQNPAAWEAHLRKMRAGQPLVSPRRGVHASAETKARLSAALTGLKRSEATKTKMRKPKSEAHKAVLRAHLDQHRAAWAAQHIGRKHPPGTGEKIAAALRGRPHTPERITNMRVGRIAAFARKRAAAADPEGTT